MNKSIASTSQKKRKSKIGTFFGTIGSEFKEIGTTFTQGTWFTRISYLVPGLGQILRGQFARGIMFLLVEAGLLFYIFGIGMPYLEDFGTLGTKGSGDNDLGVITDEVRALRIESGFPGMKVLQFAFSADEAHQNGMTNYFLPHMFDTDQCIIYTGTHDNDTLQGWLENCGDEQLLLVAQYIEGHELNVNKARALVKSGALRKDMIRSALSSSAVFCLIPMQDILGTGNEGRMNMPSTTGANWTCRMQKNGLKK